MFGDPYQLAPVPPRHGDEQRYIRDHYRSFWFFDARVWAGSDAALPGSEGSSLLDLGRYGASLQIRELTEIHVLF